MAAQLATEAKCGVPIRINRVVKIFGEDSDNPFRALKEVTVDIEAGEFVSVVGPSGCGKSTLMLMVAGLLSRSRGDIAIGGQSVAKPITDVGIAFQDHLLLDFRTALNNVTLHADIRKLPKRKIEERAKELFAQLQLTHAMNKYPRQLSGGMRQRVSLIRTLVHDPPVMIFDEPTLGLDIMTARTIIEFIRECRGRGKTVIFSTHVMREVEKLCDIVGIIQGGKLLTEGTLEQLRQRHGENDLEEVFVKIVTPHYVPEAV